MTRRSRPEDFWRRVDRVGNGCHNWLGPTNTTGYGALSYGGQAGLAHRVAAYLLGVVPTIAAPKDRTGSGFLLHRCDNKLCCNPAHWRVGTYAENQREAYARRLRSADKGEAHANAGLTGEQVADLRRRWPAETQTKLAAEFGVSQACVSGVTRGKTYVE